MLYRGKSIDWFLYGNGLRPERVKREVTIAEPLTRSTPVADKGFINESHAIIIYFVIILF